MSENKYILVMDINCDFKNSIYDKKKVDIIKNKLHGIFGVLYTEFDDISNEYKKPLIHSFLMNFFPMIGVVQIDKEHFLSQMAIYYDMLTEADEEGKIELFDE